MTLHTCFKIVLGISFLNIGIQGSLNAQKKPTVKPATKTSKQPLKSTTAPKTTPVTTKASGSIQTVMKAGLAPNSSASFLPAHVTKITNEAQTWLSNGGVSIPAQLKTRPAQIKPQTPMSIYLWVKLTNGSTVKKEFPAGIATTWDGTGGLPD